MPNIPAKVVWRRLKKHREVTKKHWDASDARKWSKGGHAQYNPHHYHTDQQIEAIERLCLATGIPLVDAGNFVSCYLHLPGQIVGACSGEFTEYVYAEMYNGQYHGYPISPQLLRKRHGVNP